MHTKIRLYSWRQTIKNTTTNPWNNSNVALQRFGLMTVARYIALSLISRYHCLDPTNRDISGLHCIGISIVEIRRSYDCLISTMGFPILVTWHPYIGSWPSFGGSLVYHRPVDNLLLSYLQHGLFESVLGPDSIYRCCLNSIGISIV